MKDENGLEVSTSAVNGIEAINKFRKDLLSMGSGVADIIVQAENYPESTLIQSYAACLFLYGQTKETDKQAEEYLERAKIAAKSTNDREKLLLSALESWYGGKIEEGKLKLENLIKEWPRDLVSAKVLEFLYYLSGQQYSGPRFLRAMEGISEHNRDSGYFLSSYSFATELCGDYEKAEALADKAVEIEEINPWAHHTLSHVLLKKGDIEGGIKILEGYEHIWNQSGQAINSHNNWHLALMYLENLEYEKALSFLQDQILREKPYINIQHFDAISLLWRIEMGGYEISTEQWKSISDMIADNAGDCYIPFNSAHYIYALARAEKSYDLHQSVSKIEEAVSYKTGHERDVWEKVGLPLLKACESFAKDDYLKSAQLLEPVITDIAMVGGSDAQVDLFRQTYLISLIKSGDKENSKNYLKDICTSDTPTPLSEYWRSLI